MSQPIRILIVEDQPEWAKAIKTNLLEIFNDLGVPCTIEAPVTIKECKKAIHSASESPYDLITLDINYREDASDSPIDGLNLLGTIGKFQSAWMVSILTGVETDSTVEDTYGAARASLLQKELRSKAYTSFPPERLLVLEKPDLDDESMLQNRLRQVCLVLRQSLKGRNLFRPLELSCRVACHRTVKGDLIKKDSADFRRAKEAMEFVKEYQEDPSAAQDPARKKQYQKELKLDVLEKKGSKLTNAEWVDDVVSLRQVRFGCGEVITLPDSPNFETIAWLLRHPGKQFEAHQIGGEVAEVGHMFDDAANAGYDDEDGDAAADYGTDEDDDDADYGHQGMDRDFDGGLHMGAAANDWDDTEAISHENYKRELREKRAKLETATGRQRQLLETQIEDLQAALGQVRKKAVGGKTHSSIKQHKSRAIAALKEAGQVELADHLEKTIRIEGGKFFYDVAPGTIIWNVD